MSGHNPHSHLSQPPNSSWNPLQIPSYIPRQPQVAHMSSNERSLVRSPLTWHTPTPPEALYSFISAKHKNLELNPLLPSFVRGPPPTFGGSVDLTIQSSRNQNSSTTSPRNLASPSPDFSMHKQIAHNVINNLQNPGVGLGPGVIQTTGSVRDKFSNSNGNTCEITSTVSSSGGVGGGGGLYIRDARQINNDLLKMSTARDPNEVSSLMNEQPVELINQTAKIHALPTSPRRLSPPRTSLLNHAPISPESTSPALPPMSIGIGINTDVINNHISSLASIQHQQQQTVPITSSAETMVQFENSPLCSAAQSPLNAASNEDSVDSNASRTRRRRKPNRIIRVPNDSDDSLPANEKGNSKIYQKDVIDGTGNVSGSYSVSDKNENCLKLDDNKYSAPLNTEDIDTLNKIENNGSTLEQHYRHQREEIERLENERSETRNNNGNDNNGWTKSAINASIINQEIENKTKSVIVDNIAANANRTLSDLDRHHHHGRLKNHENNTQIDVSKFQVKEISNKEEYDEEEEISSQNCHSNSKKISSKQKSDSDDIETIDKIAAMIASSNDNEETILEDDCVNNLAQRQTQIDKNELEPNSNKLNDLTEILSNPITTANTISNCISSSSHPTSQENTENVKEIRFEEVENKLEEMFAGIDDEQPCNVPNTSETLDQMSNDPALELEQPLQIDNENENLSRQEENIKIQSNTSPQKRSLSKQLENPPKKKRKLTSKKSTNSNQKVTKKSTKASSNEKGTKQTSTKEKLDECITTASSSGTNNDLKYKGPFVQLKSDGSINIVNTPITEDDSEKQNKVKKTLQSHHTNSERSKIRGLHVSTLSTKYDADTIDATWMCVFCKKGPHKNGLGDLFGPYIVTTTCEEFQLSQKNLSDDEFISKRVKSQMIQKSCNLPVVPAASVQNQQQQQITSGCSNAKKKKRGGSGATTSINLAASPQKQQISNEMMINEVPIDDIFIGMSKVSETSYEVWMHEDCAVWASGVYMAGSRIIGLEAAVWSSTRHKCSICSLNGAMICCLRRGCLSKAHISCARYKNWQLIETDFKNYCEKHHSFDIITPTASSSTSLTPAMIS